MRKIFCGAIALTALAGSAFAADLPSTKAAPTFIAPAPAYSWTGFYAGGYIGGAFGNAKVYEAVGNGAYPANFSGVTAGGLVGANYQLNQFVIGVEGEFGYQGGKATGNFLSASSGRPIIQTVSTEDVGRIRGRFGLAFDRALLFVAGGGSFSNEKITETAVIAGSAYSINNGIEGWNIGGGADWAITNNWIGRIEYIYDDYGRTSYNFFNLPRTGTAFFNDRSAQLSENTVRAAVVYKFGAPEAAPVVARY